MASRSVSTALAAPQFESSVALPSWRVESAPEALRAILLELADLAELEDVCLPLFTRMRQLIVSQKARETQISMALDLEEMLQQRFQLYPGQLDGWKAKMGKRWETGVRSWSSSPIAALSRAIRRLRSLWNGGDKTLRAELQLECKTISGTQLFEGRDNRGQTRISLKLDAAGRAQMCSYDLTIGEWKKRYFLIRNPSVSRRAMVMTSMDQMATACGWRFPRW